MNNIENNINQKSEIAKILGNSNIAARAARDTRKFEAGDVYYEHTTLDKKVEESLNNDAKLGRKANKDFFDPIFNTVVTEANVNQELAGSIDKVDD